jgi:serine/threonine-protein kinase
VAPIASAVVSTWIPGVSRANGYRLRAVARDAPGPWIEPPGRVASLEALESATAATNVCAVVKGPATRKGSRLGRYRLLERLGQGKQADVWRALRTEPFVEEVAVKVLSATGSDPRRRAQLRHEAERGARLDSPALLPTYEFGESNGVVFMVMPLVVGCTLSTIIDQRREYLAGRRIVGVHRLAIATLGSYIRDVAFLMAQVARAAGDAHVARVVHRDIKPGNILVRDDHQAGVFLCDFGLGRDLDIATPTQLRDGAGSPLYMAPERLLRHDADEIRCDVYALGITLYEALVLAPPFDVPDDLPRSVWAPYLATAELRPPSAVWPAIPRGLESIILRATAREPARRHASAGQFACELERFLDDALGECA